jgi:2',5'-phosphodiesterase
VVLVTAPVEAIPNREVFDHRRELGKMAAHEGERDAFRVMSYNVLFDGYTSDHAKRSKFAYTDRRVMREAYRMQLIAHEIAESNSDIVLLQEMGATVFETYFGPLMRAQGFAPLYAGKTGSTMEGCAMLIRESCFEVVEHSSVDISSAITESADPAVRAVLEMFPEVKKGSMASPTIAQIAVLQHVRDPSKRVVVSNTHLFFRYDGDLIRLLQAAALVEQVKLKREELVAESPPPAILMGGDLNAFPDAAAVRYLLDGCVPATHRNLQSAPSFRWDGVPTIEELREQGGSTVFTTFEDADAQPTVLLPAEFAHDLQLVSGCGIPEFTNYAATPGHLFAATLDYILLESARLSVRQVFPHFSREQVSVEVALPSTAFPSDHVSILCDLGWQQS